jgi:hypothetical protein
MIEAIAGVNALKRRGGADASGGEKLVELSDDDSDAHSEFVPLMVANEVLYCAFLCRAAFLMCVDEFVTDDRLVSVCCCRSKTHWSASCGSRPLSSVSTLTCRRRCVKCVGVW